MSKKQSLLEYTVEALKQVVVDLGEKPFRAAQIYSWLTAGVPFADMSNLSLALRERLAETYIEGYLGIAERHVAQDGTEKFLLELGDGNKIEAVLMQYHHGKTLCISTQVGCPMACTFCDSAIGGLVRNLTFGELLSQVITINALLGTGRQITNVVLMGTGEPLLNYENVVQFLRVINSEQSLHIAMRNISLSTCGIVPGIYKLAEEGMQVTLCLSLHSAIPGKRAQIMPVEKTYPLAEVVNAMQTYGEATGRRLIYEYILIDGLNMGEEDVAALSALLKGQNCHVNLIPLNGTIGGFLAPSGVAAQKFLSAVQRTGISATVRRTLGEDIKGACGQLRAQAMKREK